VKNDPADNPQVTEIADGVWVRVEVDTLAWIDMGDWAVFIDAHEEPGIEDVIFPALTETLGDRPLQTVVNTHTHYDHIYLNKAFQDRLGATIVNTDTTDIPTDGLWIEGPKRRLLIKPMAGCHTPEDCVIWLPDCKVLFVGDIFGWGLINLMGHLTEDSAATILTTYDDVIAIGADTIVPGHGPLCTNAELARWVEYFRWLHAKVLAALDAGQSDKQIMAEITPPEDMHHWWRFVDWKHEHSVDRMISSIRDGWRAFPT